MRFAQRNGFQPVMRTATAIRRGQLHFMRSFETLTPIPNRGPTIITLHRYISQCSARMTIPTKRLDV